MESPPTEWISEVRAKVTVGEMPGDRIDRYMLVQQIGEGGCGVVFVAEQEHPVRRRVALKVVKPGMDTKSVIARFEAERQALALMDHPYIAHVFDAGTTASGRPYFVMELVQGVRITDYCDQHSLTTATRLELFIQVCDAIQHAHQKGIIHRDIKPSNILVATTPDGKLIPKVIDFGIARATAGQQLTDKTILTAHEMLIGTPAYMSPEQVALASTQLDTRTDIYSLGVLLYELLTGTTPFDVRELLKAGFDEVRRVVREVEAVRPSTRLSTMRRSDLTKICGDRNEEPWPLIRQLRGDLDWIVMMALEKDRTRRYTTANGLALDVRRFLTGETVLARPPSKLYKFRKLVLRNKLLFAAVGTVAALLVTGVVVLSNALAQQREASREASDALTRQREASRQAANALAMEQEASRRAANALARETEARLQAIKDKEKAEKYMSFFLKVGENNDDMLKTLNEFARIAKEYGAVEESQKIENHALVLLNKRISGDLPLSLDERGSLLDVKAAIEARHGHWQEAAADVARSLEYQPSACFRWSALAALYLKAANRTAYEQFCQKLYSEHRDTSNVFFADQVAKACLFLPASQIDLGGLGNLATTAVTRGAGDKGAIAFFSVCKGLSEYRLGHFAGAAEWAQKALNTSRYDAHAHAYGVLALADWKLGKKEEARKMLAAGEALEPRQMPASVAEDPGNAWQIWLFARIQLEEAEALINSASTTANEQNLQPKAP